MISEIELKKGKQIKKERSGLSEALVVSLGFILVTILSAVFQKPITFGGGLGVDAGHYVQIAKEFASGQLPRAFGPFVYRPGTSFLAALVSPFFKENWAASFELVNVTANLITVPLLLIWLRLYIKSWKIRVFLTLLFITHWAGPFRYIFFDPGMSDHWAFPFVLLGLILMQKTRSKPTLNISAALSLIVFTGILFREFILLLPFAFLFVDNPLNSQARFKVLVLAKLKPAFLLPLVAGLAATWFVHSIGTQTDDYSFTKSALDFLYNKPLLSYIHGWLIVFGPVIFIVIYDWRRIFAFLGENQFQLIYLLGIAGLVWLGGTNTEKFVFWAVPVVYVLLGRAIEGTLPLLTSPVLFTILGLSQILAQRLFWLIPDYPDVPSNSRPVLVLTPLGSGTKYLDLWSFFGPKEYSFVILVEYLILGIFIILLLKYRARKIFNPSCKQV